MKPFAAVVFDMDGLLLDSERIALGTFETVCKTLGIPINRPLYFQCIGTNKARTKEILLDGFGKDFPYDSVIQQWTALYQSKTLEKPVPLKQGAIWLLSKLRDLGLPMGVATSTAYNTARQKLEMARIFDFFTVVVGGDQVTQSKPDPEIYLRAAERLAVSPERCLALEDSDHGVKAAFDAGMTVIHVPDLIASSPATSRMATKTVQSLFEVSSVLYD